MVLDFASMPVRDFGTALHVSCRGLLRVENLDPLGRFVLFDPQFVDGQYCRVPNLIVDMPITSIGPGIEMTITTFGSKLILPAARYAWQRLAS